ncbi:putative alkylhydroperoxidase C [Mycolicibacterium insubricum]|nr:putative alkylhydroperoxidase C [Mycolicibacterium insubricum]
MRECDMPLLTIGDEFPAYNMTAVVGGDLSAVNAQSPDDYFTTVTSDDNPGKWRVVFFWPKDFTFSARPRSPPSVDFEDRDTNRCLHRQRVRRSRRWFPMASDLKLVADGCAQRRRCCRPRDLHHRPQQRHPVRVGASVGRNVDEVLRVLDALQSDELCACNWKKGDPTLNVGELLNEAV